MKRFVNDLKKYYKYTLYSAKSSLKSEVAGSYLSWLWWILDPLFFMLVYMFVALVVFGKGEQYFPVFVFIGLSTWQFFEKVVKGSVKLVSANSAIVTKVYLPKYLLVLQKIFVDGFKLLISFALVFVMMVIFKVPASWTILYMIPLFVVLFFITFGISAILMHFGVFVEDLFNLVNVGMRIVFYMSGVFYSVASRVPQPYGNILLKVNPIAFIMSELRNVMLYKTAPDLGLLGIWFVIGVVLSIIGVRVIYKYENSYVKVI